MLSIIRKKEIDKNKPVKFIRKYYKLPIKNKSKTALEEILIECDNKKIKKDICNEVFIQCIDSSHPIDILAKGFAGKEIIMQASEKNLKKINETIIFFENYLENPEPVPEYLRNKCDIYNIYSSLAYLNESKEDWDKAIYYLQTIKKHQKENIPDNEELLKISYMMIGTTSRRIGELKLKQGIDKAKEYYNELINEPNYKNEDFKNMIKPFIDKINKIKKNS